MQTPAHDALTLGPDGRHRCFWAAGAPEYLDYHDKEWGRPVLTDDGFFERLCLEAFQSGLSWLTILRKRPAFRAAFADFRVAEVAAFGPVGVARHNGIIPKAVEVQPLPADQLRRIEAVESWWATVTSSAPPAPSTRCCLPRRRSLSRGLFRLAARA